MSAFSANGDRALREAVLVVDDEPQVLTAIEDTLEDEFRVYVETSPEVAIELLRRIPDLSVVLSDQRMPGMSGDEFLAQARELSHASRLLITGYADLEAVIRAVNLGRIFGYVSKPWSADHLKLAVHKAVEHYRLLRELDEERELLRQLMDSAPDAIYFKDLEQRYLRVNRVQAVRLNLVDPKLAIGRLARDFLPPEQALGLEREDERILREGVSVEDQLLSAPGRNGEVRWFSTTKTPIRDRDGRIAGLVGISRDVTARRRAEERVERLNRVHAVLSGINGTIVRIRDRDELFREACRIAVEAGGFRFAWIGAVDWNAARIDVVASSGADEEFLEFVRARLSAPVDSPEARAPSWRAVQSGEPVIVNDVQTDPGILDKRLPAQRGIRSLASFPVVVSGRAAAVLVLNATEAGFFDDEEIKLLRELAGDIAFALEHIEKSERLDYLAYYDPLTGLANRSLFRERLHQFLGEARKASEKLALVIADVERLRTVNESLGRQAGDELLRKMAERLAAAAEPTEVARIGADQFAVALRRVKGRSEVSRGVERMWRSWLGEPYQVEQSGLQIAAKAGIALFPSDGTDADALLRSAEAALRKAKENGERHVYHVPEMTAKAREKLTLETRLRQALERNEFVLHYQPTLESTTQRIAGVEALIRWQSPELGLVPPGEFIPLMEETGLILEAGTWALQQASLDHRRWTEMKLKPPRVAVNVSPIQLRQRDFVTAVEQAIIEGVAPTGIDLEITESVVMRDVEGNIEKLKAVRALGVRIAIDDFGTGYSSLGYLARLPVQALKIDRSFIVGMLDHPDTMTLVSTILSLARSLRLEAVAEGVDSEEQAKVLRLLRCDAMQGYLFSRPLPWEEMTALLQKQQP